MTKFMDNAWLTGMAISILGQLVANDAFSLVLCGVGVGIIGMVIALEIAERKL